MLFHLESTLPTNMNETLRAALRGPDPDEVRPSSAPSSGKGRRGRGREGSGSSNKNSPSSRPRPKSAQPKRRKRRRYRVCAVSVFVSSLLAFLVRHCSLRAMWCLCFFLRLCDSSLLFAVPTFQTKDEDWSYP